MRISDWSSDVCSSDLINSVDQHRGIFEQGFDDICAERCDRDDAEREQDRPRELWPAESRGTDRPGGRAEDREDQNDADQIGDLERDPGGAETGRASCRERVWQYV